MKKGKIAAIACVAVASLGVLVGAGALTIWNSDSMKVIRGTSKLVAQSSSLGADFYKEMGQVNVSDMTKGSYKVNFDLDVYDIAGMDDYSVNFAGEMLTDLKNKKMKQDYSISLAYYELLNFGLAVDNTEVYLDIPMLYDGSITFDSQNIDEQYNNSIFADYIGEDIEQELSLNLFEEVAGGQADMKAAQKDLMKMIRNAEITKQDGVLEIQVGDATKKCKGYFLTLKKADVNALLNAYCGVEGLYQVEADVEILIYLDKDCVIRQIQTEEDITLQEIEQPLSVAFRFTGEENALEQIKGKIGMDIEGYPVEYNFDYTTVVEGKEMTQSMQFKAEMSEISDIIGMNFEMVMDAEDKGFTMELDMNVAEDNFAMEAEGDFDVTKEQCTVNMQNCNVYYADEKLGSVDASVTVAPLDEEIAIPDGKTYPIFEFTETEFETFVLECYENVLGQYEGILDMDDLDLDIY